MFIPITSAMPVFAFASKNRKIKSIFETNLKCGNLNLPEGAELTWYNACCVCACLTYYTTPPNCTLTTFGATSRKAITTRTTTFSTAFGTTIAAITNTMQAVGD